MVTESGKKTIAGNIYGTQRKYRYSFRKDNYVRHFLGIFNDAFVIRCLYRIELIWIIEKGKVKSHFKASYQLLQEHAKKTTKMSV
jgi:hypothetical protein